MRPMSKCPTRPEIDVVAEDWLPKQETFQHLAQTRASDFFDSDER